MGWALLLLSALAFVYLLVPLAVFVATTFGDTGYLAFPPHGFTFAWYGRALSDPRYVDGLLVSLRIASTVAGLSLLIGGLAAYGLARHPVPGAAVVESLMLSPLALPGLVLAVALTLFFSRNAGWVPGAAGGWRLILGHLTVGVPCVVRVLKPVIARTDRAIEEAARNLGASPLVAFLLVTVPAIRAGLLASLAFAFILSFDEVEMALFLSSPREAPLTAVLFNAAQLAFDPTIAAVSALLIGAVAAAMLAWQAAALAMRR